MVQKAFTFIARVSKNESFRRGLATAAAGILVAGISEVAWPSEQ